MKTILSSLILASILFLGVSVYAAPEKPAAKFSNAYSWLFSGRDIKAEMGGKVAVVELFTSETCAFCPNADRYFLDLVNKANVIGLSCHVNYFSSAVQGLDRPICATRQKSYAAALTGGMKYTPQMIINGRKESVGYYYDNVMNLILDQAKTNAPQLLSITPTISPGAYQFNLKLNSSVKSADVWIALYGATISKKITYGPNAGKTLIYERPVVAMTKMATWLGDARTFKFSPSLKANPAGAVIVVQNNSGIIAAGDVRF